jgi:hypothetical protein
MVALTLVTMYRNRAGGVSVPLASGLIGSMLIAPYLHWQDLATLLLAGGIALHGRLDRWTQGSLVAGYAVVWGMYYWGTAILGPLLLVTEVAVLIAMIVRAASAGQPHATDLPDRRPLARPA